MTELQTPCGSTAKGFLFRNIQIDDKEIGYGVFIPASYDPLTPTPTIVFLNGHGECGKDGQKQFSAGLGPAVIRNFEEWPFIIIFPQKQEGEEDWEDEEPMLMEIVDKTRQEYNVDPSRIYLTGISQGGHGTWTIASMHPDLFAAIAPVCGWADEDVAKKVAGLPIWMFHGDADEAVPFTKSQDMAKFLDAAGADYKFTVYPGVGHNSWDSAYQNEKLADWLLSFSKDSK